MVGQLVHCSVASACFIVVHLSGSCFVSPPHFHFQETYHNSHISVAACMPVCLSTVLFTVTVSFPPNTVTLVVLQYVRFLVHSNLLLSQGCQVISNDWFHCDTSKLSYEIIVMIYDLSGLYLHFFPKCVTLTFLNASTETVLSEHKWYVL